MTEKKEQQMDMAKIMTIAATITQKLEEECVGMSLDEKIMILQAANTPYMLIKNMQKTSSALSSISDAVSGLSKKH